MFAKYMNTLIVTEHGLVNLDGLAVASHHVTTSDGQHMICNNVPAK